MSNERSLSSLPALFVCAIAVLIWAYFQASFSTFITQTNPMLGDPGKSVYGYAYFYNGDLYHKENFYPLEQLEVIKSGYPGKPGAKRKFTDRRFFYPAFANLFTQFTSSVYAFRLLNLAALFCSLALLFSFSQSLGFGRQAAWAATFFCIFSPAMVTFVGDSSSHLVGNTLYYLWIVLLLSVYRGNVTWRRIIGMGLLLCLWRTVYPSAGYGGALLFLLLLYKREWLKAAVPVLAVLAFPRAQMELLKQFGIRYGNDTEHLYFVRGLKEQFGHLTTQPIDYAIETIRAFLNFLFIDNPLLMLLAVTTLLLCRIKEKAFLWFVLILPICIVLPVYPASSARAYIVSGSGIIIYAMAGYGLVLLLDLVRQRSTFENWQKLREKLSNVYSTIFALLGLGLALLLLPRFTNIQTMSWVLLFVVPLILALFLNSSYLRSIFLGVSLSLLFLSQILWSIGGAPSLGFAFPYHAFVRGFFITEGMGSFMTHQPPPWVQVNYMRASGDPSEIPQSLGGSKSWADFIDLPSKQQKMPLLPEERGLQEGNIGSVLFIQSLFVCLVIGILLLLLPASLGLQLSALFLVLWGSAVLFGDRRGFNPEFARYHDQVLTIRTGERLEGDILLSQEFSSKMERLIKADKVEQVELYVNVTKRKRGRVIFKVWDRQFGIRAENTQRNNVVISPEEFLNYLKLHDNTVKFSVEFEGQANGQTYAGSWQDIGSDSARSTAFIHRDGSVEQLKEFPAFEIRLRDSEGYFHLIGL